MFFFGIVLAILDLSYVNFRISLSKRPWKFLLVFHGIPKSTEENMDFKTVLPNHKHSVSSFVSSLIFLNNILKFSMKRSVVYFVKFVIYRLFLVLMLYIEMSSFSYYLHKINKKKIIFCMLNFKLRLVNVFIRLKCFGGDVFGVFHIHQW